MTSSVVCYWRPVVWCGLLRGGLCPGECFRVACLCPVLTSLESGLCCPGSGKKRNAKHLETRRRHAEKSHVLFRQVADNDGGPTAGTTMAKLLKKNAVTEAAWRAGRGVLAFYSVIISGVAGVSFGVPNALHTLKHHLQCPTRP